MNNSDARLKVVTFTTLYPNSIFPRHGIFVAERLKHLLQTNQVDVTVIVPVPWFPIKSKLFGEYGKWAQVPSIEQHSDITVHYPRYLSIPKVGMSIAPLLLALSLSGYFRRLKKELDGKFIIDAHYLFPDGVAACLLGKWLGIPVVMTARGSDVNVFPRYAAPKAMIKWAVRSSEKVITVSETLKNKLVSIGLSPDNLVTLRNGVDLEKFRIIPAQNQGDKNVSTGLKLLSVGNLLEVKCHHLTIEAVAKIQHATLDIIGDGPLYVKLQDLIKRLGVENRVSIIDNISQTELVKFYNSADMLILPSKREGMPNVVLESLACGTPVVATNVGGVNELLTCPEAGIVIDPNSPDAIVKAVEKLSKNYPDPAATRAYAETLDWESTIDGLLKVFREISYS